MYPRNLNHLVFMDTVEHKDKFFKGQQANEEFICFFRHHWIDLIKDFAIFLIFLIIVTTTITHIEKIQEILRGNRELKLFFFTGYLLGTVYMHHFFIKMINYFVNVGVITNLRVIDHKKTIYFMDSADSVDLAQVQNIERIVEGILPSLLGFGDIRVFLNASDAVVTFRRVPNVKFHYRCIARAKENVRIVQYQQRTRKNGRIPESGSQEFDPWDKPQVIKTISNESPHSKV